VQVNDEPIAYKPQI